MKLVFTLAARSDLQAIGDWIAQDNPARALSFVDELERHCSRLTGMSHVHPVLAGHEQSGIRKSVHGRYLIFYRITSDALEILHILHGAQDWGWRLLEEE
jgi:plasmid stabilization system protein ParE